MTAISYALVRSEDHRRRGHPESPERFSSLGELVATTIGDHLNPIQPTEISEDDILSVHSHPYLQALHEAVARAPSLLDLGDTYVTSSSLDAARKAAGAALIVTEATLHSAQTVGFSMARPPGHHATPSRGMGFCLLNNVALAARHAQGMGVERILIVDFDVHHGNGTQEIFYQDPSVFYFSLHQRGIFPGTGNIEETGLGAGEGTTMNIPLPAFSGHQDYLRLLRSMLLRIGERFEPQLILVSAGYDAHWRDPLARLQLTSDTYYHIGRSIQECADRHCDGRLAFMLEGGYDPEVLRICVLKTLQALAGLPEPESTPERVPRPSPDLADLLERVLQHHGLE